MDTKLWHFSNFWVPSKRRERGRRRHTDTHIWSVFSTHSREITGSREVLSLLPTVSQAPSKPRYHGLSLQGRELPRNRNDKWQRWISIRTKDTAKASKDNGMCYSYSLSLSFSSLFLFPFSLPFSLSISLCAAALGISCSCSCFSPASFLLTYLQLRQPLSPL